MMSASSASARSMADSTGSQSTRDIVGTAPGDVPNRVGHERRKQEWDRFV
jgi:hypothetical protein